MKTMTTNDAYGVVVEQSDRSMYAQSHDYCDIGIPAQGRVQVQDN